MKGLMKRREIVIGGKDNVTIGLHHINKLPPEGQPMLLLITQYPTLRMIYLFFISPIEVLAHLNFSLATTFMNILVRLILVSIL